MLERADIEFSLHEYGGVSGDVSYGEAAAAKLGLEPGRVFKTLVAEVDGAAPLAIVPVSCRLSLKKLARANGGKHAVMADPARRRA